MKDAGKSARYEGTWKMGTEVTQGNFHGLMIEISWVVDISVCPQLSSVLSSIKSIISLF
jgi:hypothetical protein